MYFKRPKIKLTGPLQHIRYIYKKKTRGARFSAIKEFTIAVYIYKVDMTLPLHWEKKKSETNIVIFNEKFV